MLSIENMLRELSKNVDSMNFTAAQRVVINSKLEELRSLLTDVPQAKGKNRWIVPAKLLEIIIPRFN